MNKTAENIIIVVSQRLAKPILFLLLSLHLLPFFQLHHYSFLLVLVLVLMISTTNYGYFLSHLIVIE